MNERIKAYVPDVEFELIPIKNLVSNQNYQRNLSQTHIARMVANFDIHQINLVKISRRNGVNLVMNGQHTIETVAALSGSRETPVWCMIYQDLDNKLYHDSSSAATQKTGLYPPTEEETVDNGQNEDNS